MRRDRTAPQPNRAYARVGWMLAGLVLVTGGVRATTAPGPARVLARAGAIMVSATGLQPGPGHAWISQLQVRTSSPVSDQLDAALMAGAAAVGIYHQRVSVGEIPDLASCDGQAPPSGAVDSWLHYGPLLIPGRASGLDAAATATLTLPAGGVGQMGQRVPVTLYFAHAGQVTIDLPAERV